MFKSALAGGEEVAIRGRLFIERLNELQLHPTYLGERDNNSWGRWLAEVVVVLVRHVLNPVEEGGFDTVQLALRINRWYKAKAVNPNEQPK